MSKKAFTLVETAISIALLALIMTAIATIFITVVKNYQISSQKNNIQREINFVTDDISKNIKLSKGVLTELNEHRSGETKLILSLPAIDENENFLYDANGALLTDQFIYYIQGDQLHRIIYSQSGARQSRGGQDLILLEDLDANGFQVTYSPTTSTASQVKAELRVKKTINKKNVTAESTVTAGLRNKSQWTN